VIEIPLSESRQSTDTRRQPIERWLVNADQQVRCDYRNPSGRQRRIAIRLQEGLPPAQQTILALTQILSTTVNPDSMS
jgi:hypothetical protein